MYKLLTAVFISIALSSLVSCVAFDPPNYSAGRLSFLEGNYHQAYKQLYPAAQAGNPDAQYAIGYMYYYGLGIGQDRHAGIGWMQRAANQGQTQAIAAVDSILNTGYTSSMGYIGGLSKPSLLKSEQLKTLNPSEQSSAKASDQPKTPNQSSSSRKASWPPPQSMREPLNDMPMSVTKQAQLETAEMKPNV